jgi:hypothetical protein
MLAARNGSGVTSAWVNVADATTDANKAATIGVADASATVLSRVFLAGNTMFLNTYGSGGGIVVDSNAGLTFTARSGGISVTATGGISIDSSGTGVNVYMQNGNGTYFSANGTGAFMQGTTATVSATGGTLSLLGTTVYLGNPSGQLVRSDATYNNTGTFSANVGIATSPIGVLYRLTSSERYKVDITPAAVTPADVLALQPVTYYDKGQWETAGESTVGLSQQLGLIAERVAEIPGLAHLLVELNEDGAPESVNYDRVGVALIPLLHDLARRVSVLETAT